MSLEFAMLTVTVEMCSCMWRYLHFFISHSHIDSWVLTYSAVSTESLWIKASAKCWKCKWKGVCVLHKKTCVCVFVWCVGQWVCSCKALFRLCLHWGFHCLCGVFYAFSLNSVFLPLPVCTGSVCTYFSEIKMCICALHCVCSVCGGRRGRSQPITHC